MSEIGIFMVGLCVTLAVGSALVLLIWAAVQDGHTQKAMEAQHASDAGSPGLAPPGVAQPLSPAAAEVAIAPVEI